MNPSSSNARPVIREIHEDLDRTRVFALRYAVYVEEMGLGRSRADHEARLLYDELESCSRILAAELAGDVVATLRLTLEANGALPTEHERAYDLPRFRVPGARSTISVLSRFATRADRRGTSLPLEMLVEATRFNARHGVDVNVLGCQPHLINLYTRLGYRAYGPTISDAGSGLLVPMMLVLGDDEHLRELGSPLAGIAAPGRRDHITALCQVLETSTAARGDRAPERNRYWSDVHALLARRGEAGLHVFEGLDDAAVASIVTRGNVIICARGDAVIRAGNKTRTVFVVLDGALEVRQGDRVLGVATPGDVVGEVAFLLNTPRTRDVIAASDGARVLGLSEKSL